MLEQSTQMIKQQAPRDCYVCSLAMALGLTYEAITQRLGAEFVSRVGQQGCYGDEVDEMFKMLGLQSGLDFQRVYRHDAKRLPEYGASAEFARTILWGRRALIQVKSLNEEGKFHIVYWDGFELFDPSNNQTHRWDTLAPLNIVIFNERGSFLRDRQRS